MGTFLQHTEGLWNSEFQELSKNRSKSLWDIQKASSCSEAIKKELVISRGVGLAQEAGHCLYLQQVAADSTGHQHGVDNSAKRKEKRDQVWCCDWPQDPQRKNPQQTRTSSTLIIWKMTQHECSGFFQLSKLQSSDLQGWHSSAKHLQLDLTKSLWTAAKSDAVSFTSVNHWGWMHTRKASSTCRILLKERFSVKLSLLILYDEWGDLQREYKIKPQSYRVKFSFLGETQLCQKPLESWKEGRTKLLKLKRVKLQLHTHTHTDGFEMGGEQMRYSAAHGTQWKSGVVFFFLNYKKAFPFMNFLPQLSNKTSWEVSNFCWWGTEFPHFHAWKPFLQGISEDRQVSRHEAYIRFENEAGDIRAWGILRV